MKRPIGPSGRARLSDGLFFAYVEVSRGEASELERLDAEEFLRPVAGIAPEAKDGSPLVEGGDEMAVLLDVSCF